MDKPTTPAAIRARLDAAPMSSSQVRVIALTFVLSALDGYDVLSVTFAAPALTAAWGIGKANLGVVLSAGLLGMALGSFLLAPLADLVGRKTMVLLSLTLMMIGMLASAFATSLPTLSSWRIVTGLGIGCCVSVINPIAAEFANARRRAFTVSIMAIGYPVGGLVGGLISAVLLRAYGWPMVFLVGAVAAAALIPCVLWMLPESLAYLLSRHGADRVRRVNQVLTRLGHPSVAALSDEIVERRRGYRAIFTPDRIGTTLWVTLVNLMFVLGAYFVLSWLPQMIADAGYAPATASLVSAISSGAGIAGGLLLGLLAHRWGLRLMVSGMLVGLGFSTLAFGLAPPALSMLMTIGAVCGLFLFASASGIYATLATSFGDEARASGVGFAVGVGRVGSAAAPLLAGTLFATGLGRAEVSAIFGATAILSASLLWLGWQRFRLP